MRHAAGVILFAFGCLIGLRLADFDQSFTWWPLIVHRSLLTHGFLLPLLLFLAVHRPHPRRSGQQSNQGGGADDPRLRLFVQGLCLASAVHLCFDLYPAGWGRYSRVFVPFSGWTTPAFSKIWLGAGALVCLYLACCLLRGWGGLGLALLGLIVTYGVHAAREPHPSFYALVTLVPLVLVAFLLPRRSPDPDSPAGDILRWIRS